MSLAAEFPGILKAQAPLAPLVALGVGGPAEHLAEPADVPQLAKLLKRCAETNTPYRLLGGGAHVLPPDEGVKGVVVTLSAPAFRRIEVNGTRVAAGAGASLADLVATASGAELAGLEPLAGIPGSVGGAIRHNAGTRAGDIAQFIHSVTVLDDGEVETRGRNELRFSYRRGEFEGILLAADFALAKGQPEQLAKRLKKVWIAQRAQQPFGFQRSALAFRDTRGLSAVALLDKAGMRGVKVGHAELFDRDPRYVVAGEGATARDVRQLLEFAQGKVRETTGADLELHLELW